MFNLNQALVAVASKPEFSVKDRGDYVVIDYNLNSKTTFVGSDDFESKILLNLRGTAFDKKNGNIIRLGYDKFFNYGEFPEVDKTLDFCDGHVITQKLDGSCIFPLYTNGFGYELGTRAGVTDVSKLASDWTVENPVRWNKYNNFILFCREHNSTPIFEFCSRKNRVVLDYPTDCLILTSIRSIDTGRYIDYLDLCLIAEDFDIPVVSRILDITQDDFSDFRISVNDLIDDEGVVVLFETGHLTGHRVKIKSDDYCLKHKAVDSLKFEKDVLLLALEGKIDDVLPLLDDTTKTRVQAHIDTFMTMFYETLTDIMYEFWRVEYFQPNQKDFALSIKDNKYKSFLFSIRTGKTNSEKLLLDYCKKHCATQEKTKEMKKFLNFNVEY